MAVPPVAGFVVAVSAAPRGKPGSRPRREAAGQRSGGRRGRGSRASWPQRPAATKLRQEPAPITPPGETIGHVHERGGRGTIQGRGHGCSHRSTMESPSRRWGGRVVVPAPLATSHAVDSGHGVVAADQSRLPARGEGEAAWPPPPPAITARRAHPPCGRHSQIRVCASTSSTSARARPPPHPRRRRAASPTAAGCAPRDLHLARSWMPVVRSNRMWAATASEL